MYIYTGQVKNCLTGLPTPFRDIHGSPIFTGDILILFPESLDGTWGFPAYGLTTVLAHHFEYYYGKVPLEKSEKETPFIMGYRDCVLEVVGEETVLVDPEDPNSRFHIQLMKNYQDVIAGEHWTNFGFRYEEE